MERGHDRRIPGVRSMEKAFVEKLSDGLGSMRARGFETDWPLDPRRLLCLFSDL